MVLKKIRKKKTARICIAVIITASVLWSSVTCGAEERTVYASDQQKTDGTAEGKKEAVFRFIGTGAAAEASVSGRKDHGVYLTDEIRQCVNSLNDLRRQKESAGREETENAASARTGDAVKKIGTGEYKKTDRKTEAAVFNRTDRERKAEPGSRNDQDTDEIDMIGDWELTLHDRRALERLLKGTEKEGYHLGLVMLDIRTGRGVAVNADGKFYGASSIKGPFVVSLAAMKPNTFEEQKNVFRTIVVNSDNGSYINLVHVYGSKYYDSWREAVGAEAPLDEGDFADLSAEDLVRLWLLSYQYITENRRCGKQIGTLFETPNRSAIQPVLGKKYRTQTKAGWIAERFTASADAGIVYAGEHPYILAVVSDYPSDLKKLEPYVELMDRIHMELTGNRLARKRAREYARE